MSNQQKLRQMMAFHGLTSKDVGAMIHRGPVTVRRYMCGSKPMNDMLLEVLEMKIQEATSGTKN